MAQNLKEQITDLLEAYSTEQYEEEVVKTKKRRKKPSTIVKNIHTIEFSWTFYLRTLLVIGGVFLLTRVYIPLIIIFFAFVIASAFLPAINYLHKRRKFPKGLAVLTVYGSFGLILGTLLVLIINPLLSETNSLLQDGPALQNQMVFEFNNLMNRINIPESVAENALSQVDVLISDLGSVLATNGLSGFATVTSLLTSVVFAIVASVYMVFDHDNVVDLLLVRIQDPERKKLANDLIIETEKKMGRWLLSQLMMMFIIGTLSFIALSLIRVDFALPLAGIAGLMAVVPYIGPLIAMVPAILIALVTGSVLQAFLVWGAYVLIQQMEGWFITPRVMGNVAGVSTGAVFIGFIFGVYILGLLGTALTVPALVMIKIGYDYYHKYRVLSEKV